MAIMPPDIEEHAVQQDAPVNGAPAWRAQEHHDHSVNPRSSTGAALGAIALTLVFALAVGGLWLFRSVRRLDRRIAQVNQQVERLSRRVGGAELQSQSFAQQAAQAAASARAAAQQRDEAKEAAENSAAQTQSALQAAAAAQAQAKAKQAGQKTEESGIPREQDLQQLQGVLGQIAETHRTAVGLVMTLGEKSLRFDADKAEIKPQSRAILNHIASVLTTLKQYSIYVYGYTDDAGTADSNLKLSARRAEAIRAALVQAGISPALITAKGFGKSDPRVKGSTAAARSANRRIEISIVDSRTLTAPVDRK